MSYISDFKTPPISLFGTNGGQTTTDTSLATLVGTRFSSGDGRQFVLVQNGASALTPGLLVQGPATIGANHTGLAVAAACATGATTITATLGGTATTANQYAGGFAVVSAAQGIGQTLRIASNTATGTSGVVSLALEDALSQNLTTSSKVTLTLNPYGSSNGAAITTHGVILSPSSTSTGLLIGGTLYPIAASSSTVANYGWIQSKGPIAITATGTATAGLGCMLGDLIGNVAVHVVASNAQIGRFITTAESGKAQLVTLEL